MIRMSGVLQTQKKTKKIDQDPVHRKAPRWTKSRGHFCALKTAKTTNKDWNKILIKTGYEKYILNCLLCSMHFKLLKKH